MEEEEAPLVAENSETQTLTKKNHTRDVHILSSAFLLIFLAYGAVQNLESTINTEEDLGTISLGILYSSFMVFSFFASLVVRFLGTKNALVLGTTGYWLFIAANLKPTWYTMVPASLYMGFSASIIWVAEGTYLTSTARSHAHDLNLEEGNVIGNFNGEFWGMFAGHQFVGNLMSLVLLKDGTCSLAMGRLTSGLKSITLIVCAGAFIQLIVLLWLLLKYSVTSGVLGILYPLLMAAALGIGDGIFNTQLNALLGMLFKHDMEGAFAQLKVWQCVSIAVVFFVSPYISLHAVLVVMLVAVCISVVGFLFLTLMVEKAFSFVD
ncbi:hypothetical protein TEA_017686 [Camellia sinensis var. sinensis]|uniref:UNC93-like protein 3 n=1 Tax=Camellia sinensis var. sinensis TaxID=542762 RepID=A0A4S4DTD5_CAMSN|nr:hypothetical protein TEA_017686 [Camellia sinensis var. sinensis]